MHCTLFAVPPSGIRLSTVPAVVTQNEITRVVCSIHRVKTSDDPDIQLLNGTKRLYGEEPVVYLHSDAATKSMERHFPILFSR